MVTIENGKCEKCLTECPKSFTLEHMNKTFDQEEYPFGTFKRAADGGIAVMGKMVNGPVRAN